MKKIFFGALCGIFYLAAAYLTVFYALTSLDERLTLYPIARLIFLCGTALCVFIGSRILSLTLMRTRSDAVMKITLWVIFLIYLTLLLTFTLFDEYFGRSDLRFIFTAPDDVTGIYTKTSVNLIPLKNIGNFTLKFLKGQLSSDFFITNVGGNLLAFTPFALFVPLLTERGKRFFPFALITAIAIVFIELTQITLLTGFCDVDDLILNLGGACIAYGILSIPFITKAVTLIFGVEYKKALHSDNTK